MYFVDDPFGRAVFFFFFWRIDDIWKIILSFYKLLPFSSFHNSVY